ncbi:MAG: hypothetical protein K0R51_723 [Cytophagaceae bacterium]|nr:hypothetical protein [Cytophagaceae bacterium]
MNLKSGMRALLVQAPKEAIESIQLPELDIQSKATGEFDYIHLFTESQSDFHKRFPLLKNHLKENGTLWLSWPKSGQLDTDLTLIKVIEIGYDYGLVESTCLSINSVWSALKFTHPKKGKSYHNSYGKLKDQK